MSGIDPPPVAQVPVWDLPTRVFHWLLVVLVTTSAITGQFAAEIGFDGMIWHQRCGYAILALLLFRLAWGFVGGSHARFRAFLRGPAAVLDYLPELLGRRPATPHVGHNPLGGWSVLLMLIALCLQVTAGLFIADEDLGVEGPFAKLVSNKTSDAMNALHAANFWVLAGLVAMHLSALLYYWLAKGENLVRPMLTGTKRLPPSLAAHASKGGGTGLGLALAAVAGVIVWLVVTRV